MNILVVAPHPDESHPDHRATHAITLRALRNRYLPAEYVLAYEVWTPLREYSVVADISEQMARKLQAIRCYRSQLEAFNYLQATTGLNRYRGALAARTIYAEVFQQATNGEGTWPR